MDSYYCKNCEAIAVWWNVVSRVTYLTRNSTEIVERSKIIDGFTSEEKYTNTYQGDREEVDNSEVIEGHACIECGYNLEEIYIDKDIGIKIIESFEEPLYQKHNLLPIKYKEDLDFTRTDIELALFEFKIANS